MKIHGDRGWESFPSYLDIFIPMVLDILDELNLKITFFIVGQDAAFKKNHDALKLITERCHEAGNHSFNHDPWLHLHPKDRIRKEILETEEQILKATGQKPLGFRGPGFSWSPDLLEALVENDYLYDASTLPTFIGPLARVYYFWKSDLTEKEKEKRRQLFGGFREGARPVKAYYMQIDSQKKILEIPVTTVPIIKTPFHLSYLIYLSRVSELLMAFYLNLAIYMCKITATSPSFLLHPLDIMGSDLIRKLAFFPGMDIVTSKKTAIFKKVIKLLSAHFDLVNMSTHAEILNQNNNLKIKTVAPLKAKAAYPVR
jgi:hypothetical protein